MMNDVLKQIKSKNILRAILFFIVSIILLIIITFIICEVLIEEEKIVAGSAFTIVFLFLLILSIIKFMKHYKLAKNPESDNVFKKYGSSEDVTNIINEMTKNTIYKDNNIIISPDYICGTKDYEKLISCDNVLGAHIVVHKRNGAIIKYQLVLIDKYNQKAVFNYNGYDQNNYTLLKKILLIIEKICPNAEIGYTLKEKENIKSNSKELK